MKAIKLLLSVRQSTHNDICLLESGYPSLEAVVKSRQQAFFRKMMREREGMEHEDPLMFAIHLTLSDNKVMAKYIQNLESSDDFIGSDLRQRRGAICASKSTRPQVYLDMNPGLSSHAIYDNGSTLEDDLRINFTRLRVSSHRLRVETGRWSRTPADQRLCQCGSIQTEKHVVTECGLVQHLRDKYALDNIDFHAFMTSPKSVDELRYLRDVFDFYG